jgi:glucokinase
MPTYVLAGDIGGTKTNLAVYAANARHELALVREETFPSKQHGSLDEIVRDFLGRGDEKIEAGAFGIAGPVTGDVVVPTNLPWKDVVANDIAREIGCRRVRLMNDLATTGYGARFLPADQIHVLNEGKKQDGNIAVIAAGTGLGQALLFWDGRRHQPSSTEGGHADFAPRDEVEIEMLRFLMQRFPRVTYERLLSGPGIVNIFRFLDEGLRKPVAPQVREQMKSEDPGAVISRAATDGTCATCMTALDMFIRIYGAQAGNLALTLMATGGVYVGGGIVTKILQRLTAPADDGGEDSSFMAAFKNKQPFAKLMSDIPVHIILNPKASLIGAAHAAGELCEG